MGKTPRGLQGPVRRTTAEKGVRTDVVNGNRHSPAEQGANSRKQAGQEGWNNSCDVSNGA